MWRIKTNGSVGGDGATMAMDTNGVTLNSVWCEKGCCEKRCGDNGHKNAPTTVIQAPSYCAMYGTFKIDFKVMSYSVNISFQDPVPY